MITSQDKIPYTCPADWENEAMREIANRTAFAFSIYSHARMRCRCQSFQDAMRCELFIEDVAQAMSERAQAGS
jgi:hypothetical protein